MKNNINIPAKDQVIDAEFIRSGLVKIPSNEDDNTRDRSLDKLSETQNYKPGKQPGPIPLGKQVK